MPCKKKGKKKGVCRRPYSLERSCFELYGHVRWWTPALSDKELISGLLAQGIDVEDVTSIFQQVRSGAIDPAGFTGARAEAEPDRLCSDRRIVQRAIELDPDALVVTDRGDYAIAEELRQDPQLCRAAVEAGSVCLPDGVQLDADLLQRAVYAGLSPVHAGRTLEECRADRGKCEVRVSVVTACGW